MATSSSPATAATNAVAKGTVVFVQGEAYLRDSSGKLSAIKPGDVVIEGQEIVTHNGAVVELQLPGGAKVSVGPNRELLLNDEFFTTATPERSENVISSLGAEADKVIQALNAGKDPFEGLEDPAAGLTGGGLGDQTHDFVRLVRVLEEVTPVSYSYSTSDNGVEFLPTATAIPQTVNTPPQATDDTVAGTEDQPLIVDVLANDSDANNDPLVVTSATAGNGQVTINPDGSLRYVPNPDFNGPDTVTYTISDGKGGTSTATVTINVVAVNDAPVALPDVATTPEDQPVTVNVLANDSDPDGDPLTVTGATVDPALGSVVVNPDGTLTFTPTPNFNGPVVITYTVSDDKGGTASSTVTVNVTPVNDNPVANPDVATTLENTPVTVPVLGNDSDPEGNPLTVTGATVDPALGSVAINPDGTLTFTPAPDFNGPVVINYTISDGQGGTATSTVTVNVTPDNAPPVANPDSATTPEDQPITVNVLGNDSDPDGDPLSVTGATVDPAKGTVVVNPDGTLTFNPAANVNGPVVVTYTIADGNGGTATSTITIDVTPQNDAPVATPDSTTTPEDQPVTVNVLGNDSDPDGDTLTVTGASVDPAKGSVVVNPDGTLTFTPAANINGPVLVTYTIDDGQGGIATSTVTIDVIPDADDAQLGTGSGAVKEDTPAQSTASGTLSIVDPDAGEAVFQPQTNVAGTYGSFSVNTAGAWTYTIDNTLPVVQALKEGETRTEVFTVRSADGTATTVSLTIIGTNDGPVANPNTATTPEEQPVTINVLGNDTDPDGDALNVTGATVDPTKGSVTVNPDGTLTFTPATNVNGPVVVTYSVADGHGGTASSTVTINVTPVNDNASISTGAGTTREDAVLLASGTLTITDPDAGEAAFQPQTDTTGTYGSFSIDETGHWAFTLDNGNPLVQNLADGESRTESFTVRSVDGTESTVVITILGTNETIGAPGVGIVKEDNTLSTGGSLIASGGASFVPQPATPGTYGSFTLNTDGSWNYVLNNPASVVQSLGEGQTRTETFPVTLSDGTSSTVTITVVGTNDPALIGPGSGNVTEDTVPSTGGTLSITDVDGGEAGFQPQNSVAGTYGSFSLDAAGNWTYTLNNAHPDVQALGVGDTLLETFPVLSTDGTSSSVVVTINGTNDGPVANPNTATTPEDQPVTVNVLGNDTDPDGDTLTVTGASVDPAKGTVVVNADGTLTFNPAANINGPVVVTYTIADGHGGTASSTVTIDVTPVNDAPVAQDDTNSLSKTATNPATGNVITNPAGLDSDLDGDTLSVSLIGSAPVSGATVVGGAFGTLTIHPDGSYSYIQDTSNSTVTGLAPGATLTDSFSYTVSDGKGGTATAELRITIAGLNTPPIAAPDAATTNEDEPIRIAVLGNDSDPEGDALTITNATVDPTKGSVVINADGTLTFNPAPNFNGPVVVTYSISDGKGGTATSTVNITVNPVNDAPVANPNTATTPEDQPVTVNVLGNDTDPDGDTLSVTGATVDPAKGTVTVNPDGTLTFNPAANTNGPVVVTYTIADGHGGTASST
ncbi:retention module-containing protein, partial [Zoogloea sp.]|uniref:retention module-containing protein n=1 Tax=Zoogloea sp. TaxID=49181 RepID=UPI0025D16E85